MSEGIPKSSEETGADTSYVEMAEATVDTSEKDVSVAEEIKFPEEEAEAAIQQITKLNEEIYLLVQGHPELKESEAGHLLSKNMIQINGSDRGFLDLIYSSKPPSEDEMRATVAEAKKGFEQIVREGRDVTGQFSGKVEITRDNVGAEIKREIAESISEREGIKQALTTTIAQLEIKGRLAKNA